MSSGQLEGMGLEFGVCSRLGQRFHFPRIPPPHPAPFQASTLPLPPQPRPRVPPHPFPVGVPGQI